MAAPPPPPFQDLRALVLGDDTLDLEQQVVLRAGSDRAIEKADLHASPPELLHQQRLMRMPTSETVGGQHINTVHLPDGDAVAQPFQSGPPQGGAAVAVIHELEIRVQHGTISPDSLP